MQWQCELDDFYSYLLVLAVGIALNKMAKKFFEHLEIVISNMMTHSFRPTAREREFYRAVNSIVPKVLFLRSIGFATLFRRRYCRPALETLTAAVGSA